MWARLPLSHATPQQLTPRHATPTPHNNRTSSHTTPRHVSLCQHHTTPHQHQHQAAGLPQHTTLQASHSTPRCRPPTPHCTAGLPHHTAPQACRVPTRHWGNVYRTALFDKWPKTMLRLFNRSREGIRCGSHRLHDQRSGAFCGVLGWVVDELVSVSVAVSVIVSMSMCMCLPCEQSHSNHIAITCMCLPCASASALYSRRSQPMHGGSMPSRYTRRKISSQRLLKMEWSQVSSSH